MKQNYLNNIPIEEALTLYLGRIREAVGERKTETVKTNEAFGRVLSKAVYAVICSPHYNASAMDGIAVKASETVNAAENEPLFLPEGSFCVVDTGDATPDGYDAVIMVEDITEKDGGVLIYASAHPWQNIRQIGEDICMGDMLAPSFTVLTPQLCGALLAGGVPEVECIKKPLFGIIPTGDEIVSPTSNPKKGEIIEFNSVIFSGMLKEMGADSKTYGIVPDKKALLTAAIKKAVEECDAVLVLAGSSAGRDDYTSEIIDSLGEVFVHGIAAKPGKPAVLGLIGKTPVVGIPGYPVSGIVVMNALVKPVADYLSGKATPEVPCITAVTARSIVSSLKYKEFVRVTVGKNKNGFFAQPLPRAAGVITSFTKADGILEVPQNAEGYEIGESVSIRLLRPVEDIENALIVTGSHDPLIDEIADLLKRSETPVRLCSSHVGSMGAVTAVRTHTAHLGGIHLLDTDSGAYNESYIQKYFPNGGARLVKGVGRIKGLMVKKGNPLNIKSFEDISIHRYVNRQKGSGTRILCDFLVKKHGLDETGIEGYYTEEFTHTAVAAQIANGNADCGLGIYSAAKMYDLDFIEICVEEYDFLIDETAYDEDGVQAFLKILKSEEFKKRLNEMGGYRI